MKPADIEQALLDGLIQGIKDHVAKITDNIIADGGEPNEAVARFANGLRATRAFYVLAIAKIETQDR